LLGDPGIGKTFLATELAGALGVDREKLSAGGAQVLVRDEYYPENLASAR
jgi:MoxR-like ATPase